MSTNLIHSLLLGQYLVNNISTLYNLFDPISSDIYIFDFEKLKTTPEYEGKSNVECVEEFIKGRYPYNQILNYDNATDGKIYSQIEFDNLG